MNWSRSQEGYLQIDHRASPGTKDVPSGSQLEVATATCCHCGGPFPFKHRIKVNWCRRCNAYVCDSPKCHECKPYSAFLDQKLEEIHRLIQAGKV